MSLPNDALNQIAGAYGSVPTDTGAQSIYLPCFAFEAAEDTTLGSFYDKQGNELTFHPWKGKILKSGKKAYFGQNVHRFSITTGGEGQCLLTTDEMPEPKVLSILTTADGTALALTFDRPIADPAGLEGDFTVLVEGVEVEITALALNVTDARVIDLTLAAPPVVFGQEVVLSMQYGSICSTHGALAEAIVDYAVNNEVTQIPVLQSVATDITGNRIILTYNIDMLDPGANKGDFSLKYGGVAKVINSAALGADVKTIELTPAVAAVNANVITLSLVAGNIKGATGGLVAALANQAVVNNVPEVPILQTAETNEAGTLITLTYNIDMQDPAANVADFSLKYGGVAAVISAAALGANIKTIELTPAVAAVNADVITLSLVAGNIKGATGGLVAALVNQAIVNNVPA